MNRAVCSRLGTDLQPGAVQTALLFGSHEPVLSLTRIKNAVKRPVTRREMNIDRLYQLTSIPMNMMGRRRTLRRKLCQESG